MSPATRTLLSSKEFGMHDLPKGTVTLLFTDIEGSTRLLQRLGERYTDLLEECRHLLRETFHYWNGHEVDTQGDASFVALARATDAIAAAVDAQHALATSFSSSFPACLLIFRLSRPSIATPTTCPFSPLR